MTLSLGPLEPHTLRLWPWLVTGLLVMTLGGSPLSFFSFSYSHLYYTLSSLLAFIILSLAYSRFRGLFGPENNSMSLTVKWGRERSVPSLLFSPPLTPDMPHLYRAPSRPLPHLPHSPISHFTVPLIRACAASRSHSPHSIPNSPLSGRLSQNTHVFPLMLSNSSMRAPL
jgi:hypothetical protein